MDLERAERAFAELLEAVGRAPTSDPELAATPARAARAFALELLAGYGVDLEALLAAGTPLVEPVEDLVVVRGLDVVTVCPHHLLTARGTATVAYLPGARLLGLGAVAALVDALGRRLTLQEQLGRSVVEALRAQGGARGAYCRLELTHACLSARGACQAGAVVVTVATSGELTGAAGSAQLAAALCGDWP